MRLRLYVDEDSMRHSLIRALRLRNVDVLTPLEAGTLEFSDVQQLEWAAAHERALFSHNVRDFYQLHSEWINGGRHHAGIVLVQQRRFSVGEQMRRLLRLTANRSAEELRDQVEFLSAWG